MAELCDPRATGFNSTRDANLIANMVEQQRAVPRFLKETLTARQMIVDSP